MYVWRDLIVEIEALFTCMIWRCCLVDGGWMLEAMFWAGGKKMGGAKIISLIH
jgi:hypothetical protein